MVPCCELIGYSHTLMNSFPPGVRRRVSSGSPNPTELYFVYALCSHRSLIDTPSFIADVDGRIHVTVMGSSADRANPCTDAVIAQRFVYSTTATTHP